MLLLHSQEDKSFLTYVNQLSLIFFIHFNNFLFSPIFFKTLILLLFASYIVQFLQVNTVNCYYNYSTVVYLTLTILRYAEIGLFV